MRSRWAALVLVFLVAAGCQRQSSARISAEAPATDLVTAARGAMASRDWLAAAPLFRQAIAKTPAVGSPTQGAWPRAPRRATTRLLRPIRMIQGPGTAVCVAPSDGPSLARRPISL